MVVIIAIILLFYDAPISAELCEIRRQVHFNATQATLLNNGSLSVHGGILYPNGTFWIADNSSEFIGCPCEFLPFKCISHCSNVKGKEFEMSLSLETTKRAVPGFHHFSNGANENSSYILRILSMSGQEETVNFFEKFYPIEELSTNGVEDFQYAKFDGYGVEEPLPEEELNYVCYLTENNYIHFYGAYDEPHEEGEQSIFEKFLCFSIVISIVSLVLLITAFFTTHETKYMHGKNIVCQSFAFLVCFLGTAINLFQFIQTRGLLCDIVELTTYFFTMSAFFWLNAMCFDMFWTFCKSSTGNKLLSETTLFWIYSLYAWLSPLLLTFAVVITHNLDPNNPLATEISNNTCFINTGGKKAGLYLVMYGPMVILLVLNFVFFFLTLWKIYQSQRDLLKILKTGNKATQRRTLVYVKLFFVMGGLWITEFVSWAINDDEGVWAFFDLLNALRGFWLVVFCVLLSKRVRVRLMQKVTFALGIGNQNIFTTNVTASSKQSTDAEPETSERNREVYSVVESMH